MSDLSNVPPGCQVSGPWGSADLDGLSELVQELRLCSQGLNKLDRQSLKQCWDKTSQSRGHFADRNSRCLFSVAAAAAASSWSRDKSNVHFGNGRLSRILSLLFLVLSAVCLFHHLYLWIYIYIKKNIKVSLFRTVSPFHCSTLA